MTLTPRPVLLVCLAVAVLSSQEALAGPEQPELDARSAPIIDLDGMRFKDLNHNGALDLYEDWRASVDDRVDDLIGRMSVAAKAGMMVHPAHDMGEGGSLAEDSEWTMPGGDFTRQIPGAAELLGRRTMERGVQNSFLGAFDIGTFTDVDEYKQNVDDLIEGLKELPTAKGVDEVFAPGEPEDRTYQDRSANGIPLPPGTVSNLRSVAEKYEIDLPF